MNNEEFLRVLERSFAEFIRTGTSRSTVKLVPLHGAIAADMAERFGPGYKVMSQGFAEGKEGTMHGRYIAKKVDITILNGERALCGIAVKFVMQNYAQNSNNYFENMMGETANIRASRRPYFQLLAIPDRLPYYDRNGMIKHWEVLSPGQLHKYRVLDADNPDVVFHSPNKTLIYILHLPEIGEVTNREEYRSAYERIIEAHPHGGYLSTKSVDPFANSVILNDYEKFADKVYHSVLAQ